MVQAQQGQGKAGEYTQAAKDKASELTGSAKDTAGQTQDKAGDYGQAAKEKTSSAADTMGSKVSSIGVAWSWSFMHTFSQLACIS